MTSFPWKLFKNGQEIVFPRGARRFVSCSVEQIPNSGEVRFDINANAVWTGDTAFRRHMVTISCTDQTAAPISNLWQGDDVRLEAPMELAVPGPVAVLPYDPVPGSVYGVDANDRTVGSTASGSRNVNITGAVAIRYRPILECKVFAREALTATQGRADAGWSLQLVELSGEEAEGESDGDFVRFAPMGLRIYEVGTPLSFSAGAFATTNTGLPITYSLVSGSWPAGISMTSAGLVSGNPAEPGLRYVVVRASSGSAYADNAVAFYCPEPTVVFGPVAAQTHVPGTAFSLDLAPSVTVSNSAATPTFSIVSGSLPTGLSLSSAGVISGTPTAFGAFSSVIRASIPGGLFDDQRVAFNAVAPTIVSNGVSMQDFTVGTAFSFDLATLVTITGTADAPTFTADVGSLPAGLSMSPEGIISGTPTSYGAYAFTARAELPSGQWTEVSVAFFAQNPDELPDAVILGGTPQTWLESGANGSTTYDASDFTASGMLTVLKAGWVEYILVGGGAGGASVSSTAGGGGGGAGGFRRERIYLNAGTYNVSIGGGGTAGTDGSDTSFTDGATLVRSVAGGARGGSMSAAGGASGGASGGGGGASATAGGAGGVAASNGLGSNGGAGSTSTNSSLQHGGGGGGFSTIGFQGNSGRGHGGGGIKVKLWAVLEFCGGGGGGAGTNSNSSGAGRNGAGNGGNSGVGGASATANSGSGGGGAGGFTSGTRTGGAGGSGRAIFIVKRRLSA